MIQKSAIRYVTGDATYPIGIGNRIVAMSAMTLACGARDSFWRCRNDGQLLVKRTLLRSTPVVWC